MSERRDDGENEPQLFDLPLEAPDSGPPADAPQDIAAQRESPAVAAAVALDENEPQQADAQPPQAQHELLQEEPEPPQADPDPLPEAAWEEPEEAQRQIALEEAPPDELVPFESEPPPTTWDTHDTARSQPQVATLGQRLLSGGADLLIHAGALAGAALGLRLLGVDPGLSHWPSLLAFLLSFSFLYTVVALAFWGQTAGMAWFGLAARESPQFPLSFAQACSRWLGGWLTAVFLGLPMLLVFFGSSLSDRLSSSTTYSAFPTTG